MATPNVGILTNSGKALIDQVNAGQTKITFSKIVFSSMDNSQLTDDQIKALTAITPQEVVVNNPEVTLDKNTGETRIRATGNNEALTDGVYVKTYAVYAKDDSGNEILYGLTISPNPNYLPEYDGVTPQAVTYSYKVNISNTSNITFTNSNDIYVSDTDLAEALQPYAKTVDVNQQLDKKVNTADMRKPASDVAGIEEVNAKQDKVGYTPADDSKVVHNSGDEEIAGTKTFDTAPIDKTTGNPYITKDGVPAVPSTLADTTKLANFTAGLQSGGVSVATSDDLKSVENSAWRVMPSSWIKCVYEDNRNPYNLWGLYKVNQTQKTIDFICGACFYPSNNEPIDTTIDFSSIVDTIASVSGVLTAMCESVGDISAFKASGAVVKASPDGVGYYNDTGYISSAGTNQEFAKLTYKNLIN